MKRKPHPNQIVKPKITTVLMAALASVSILLSAHVTQAQTLQFRYTFEDGPGTTTTNDPSSAIFPLSMNMISANGVLADLHGVANSGIQGKGASLDISTNPIAGNAAGAFALLTNNATLGTLGVITNFTASVWLRMPNLETNTANQGSRIYGLMGSGLTDFGTAANSLGFQPQLTAGGVPKVVMRGVIGTTFITPAIYYDFPTNEWIFLAMTYDNVSGNAALYYGTEASPAKMYTVRNIGAGLSFDFSGTPSFSLGDRPSKGRSFPGNIDDARFYTGSGDANFIENIRQSAVPVIVAGLVPDGSVLQGGTNTLSFTATSTNGINSSGIKVAVNGADVTPSLFFTPTTGGQIVSYTNLPVNPSAIAQVNINAVRVSILVTDNSGVVASNSYVYDAFDPRNFTWECEDYDFGGGLFIDNPVMSFVGPDVNTYYQSQNPYVNLTDANDNGNLSGPNRVYRDPGENVETEFSIGTGINGGQSIGELMRQKVLNAFAITNSARDVNVGYFDGGTGSGLPNWMNYTRTFPSGNFNVYLRVADGGGNVNTILDVVTNGWGTSSQLTTNIGTFAIVNSGGWDSFAWVPLRDSGGNLIRVQLGGTNTLRLTAGGGNINFVMLTPANTNLPTINNIYPNGTNLFQPSATFTFTVTSPAGVTINTNSIKLRLAVTNLLGQGFVTNLTATNGLTITGNATNRIVTSALNSNSTYSAAINVTDANGSPAAFNVLFDTLNPSYTWEAPDYDHDSGQFVPDPIPVDGYLNLSGASTVDFFFANVPPGNSYRDNTIVGVENNADTPMRLQFLTNSPAPQAYDVGYYNGGNWLNYTRNFPAGEYNMFVRAADGSTGGALGNVGISVVTNGWGTSPQGTKSLGTFNIPVTGGWQTYTWAPLRDSNGNLVKFVGGTTNTLRATSAGSQNVYFYALFPANTNLPALSQVFPNGAAMYQPTNTFSFKITSTVGVATNSVVVTVNGTTVSNLVFSGTVNNWNVTYPHLAPNSSYVITVLTTDLNGNAATTTAQFNTMNPNNYTWEAEDFDHDGGLFIDNPQTNAYLGLGAVTGADAVQVNFNANGGYNYRSSGSFTALNSDFVRPQYQDINNPQSDYEIGYFSDGAWASYTRNYPAGTYNVFGRFATASATGTDATLSLVTGGWGTLDQTTNMLGSFAIPNTGGWETYAFVPLRDASGNLVTVTFNGSTNTLQLGRPVDVPASADANVNFLMLAPVLQAKAAQVGTNAVITFSTITGFNYQVQYKTNLNDSTWLPVGSPVSGNNNAQSVNDPMVAPTRFYRVQVQ